MIYTLRIYLLLSLLAAAMCQTAAQVPTLFFNSIGKTEGLTSGKVRSIMQDRSGFIYLCTTAGIERFDGYSLSHFLFHGNPELSALMNQETRACLQDKQGNFWIATDFNGLFEYNPKTGEAHRYLQDEQPALYLIDAILDNKGEHLLLATNRGIVRFGLLDKKVQFLLKDEFFLTVFEDNTGGIWAGSLTNNVYLLDPLTNKITSWLQNGKNGRKSFPGYYCRSIAQDLNGDMLFAADNGLFRMDIKTTKIKGYFNNANSPYSYPGGNVSDILVDSRGQLWLGTFGSGLVFFDRQQERFYNYQRKKGMLGSLAGNNIECMFEDDAGQIWVGDHSQGVSYFNGKTDFIRAIQVDEKSADPLMLRQINCLFTSNGTLWIGLPSGMASYSNTTGQFKQFPLGKTPFAAYKEVTALLKLPSGDLLAGTSSGVLKFNPVSGKYAVFLPDSLHIHSSILSMMLEGDSAVWISTTDAKLWRINLNKAKVRRFEQENKIPIRAECNAMFQTSSGRLCFGSYGGFCEYNVVLDSFIPNHVPGYWSEEGNAVAEIGEDSFGTVWIARYGGGLDAYEPKSRRYRHFGLKDGLPDLFCITLQRDNYGRFWVGTENGLVVFNSLCNVFDPTVKLGFKVFQTSDGIVSNQVSSSATLQHGSQQLLYFGADDGMTEVRPGKLEFNNRPPIPSLTAFYLFNRPLIPSKDGILKLPIEETKEITLPPKQNFFTLEFSALNLLSPEKNRYRYLLEGYDPVWVEAGNRHSATYTNVPPGSYTFRVEAFNSDGISSKLPLIMKISVLPAWYQTWWFSGLVLGAFLLSAYGYFRWRSGQLRKMEALRQSIAADLHDEVGASLTSIQILAQLARHHDPARSSEALEKLPEQVRHTAASLREIVWNINPKNTNLALLISELSRYAGEVFEKMDIHYTLNVDEFPETASLDMVARQHLLRIFKESLNNITKHSQADMAVVEFKIEKNELVLTVRDNGRGFDPATVRRGNGLDNMQKRTAAVGGRLSLRSSLGEGTQILLRLPLHWKKQWRRLN